MKAELEIDTSALEERITRKVVKALKPLLKEKGGDSGLFTVKTLAVYLGVSDKWIYERVQFKEIPHYKVGGNLRFKKTAIDSFLEENCEVPAASPLTGPLKVAK